MPCLPKHYKRREHLVRHASSHKPDRPYRCGLCSSSFQRADLLKRHVRSCDGNGSKPGAKKRACARCARQKKACSGERPCSGCVKKGLACIDSASEHPERWLEQSDSVQPTNTDSWIETGPCLEQESIRAPDPTPFGIEQEPENFQVAPLGTPFNECQIDDASFDWQEYLLLASESQVLRENPLLNTGQGDLLRFLDRFTSNTGFIASFDYSQPRRLSPPSPELYLSHPLVENISDPSTSDCIPLNWLSDPLSLKTHEILLLVEEVVKIKPRNSSVTLSWSSSLKNCCLQFFSPSNLRRLLGLYWAIWYPNINLIHRPTFDPVSAKPALLATMAVTGACVSPDLLDNEDARIWLNCVEEIVFIDDDFNEDSTSSSDRIATQRPKIQILQAAYMVCMFQNWEGTDSSKARVRHVGIQTARHLKYSLLGRIEFDWREFAAREELIRVFTWTFLLDTAFVIFHNLPPRMVIREMRMHMAVPESCFQAMTANECHQNLQVHLPIDSPYWDLSMRSAFESLSKDKFLDPTRIFQYRSSVSTSQNLSPICNTLRNWRSAWDMFASTSSSGDSPHITIGGGCLQLDTMWKRIGFCRHCPEYWLLAKLMADRLSLLGSTQQGNEQVLHDNGPLDPILRNYDQTSMRQVNDLILGFKAFQL
ncbi:hypothetical protein N7470_002025 [Penicillium chermesinum]|nr:hypothetical protein N7470_002025 [Penicillium chermesinum]